MRIDTQNIQMELTGEIKRKMVGLPIAAAAIVMSHENGYGSEAAIEYAHMVIGDAWCRRLIEFETYHLHDVIRYVDGTDRLDDNGMRHKIASWQDYDDMTADEVRAVIEVLETDASTHARPRNLTQ